MSRIGKQPIDIPAGVTITVGDKEITVAGPKGQLIVPVQPMTTTKVEGTQIVVTRKDDEPKSRAWHGLQRALLNNAVQGVTKGFEKKLEINGVGFRLSGGGQEIEMALGFSHPVKYRAPEGVQLTTNKMEITVSGIDKQKVGQVAAEIRSLKKPEPYHPQGWKGREEIMNKEFRANRTRAKIHGTAERPRLTVHFSNLHITAQIIDDDKKVTLAYATTVGAKMTGTKTEKAAKIGEEIAKKAKAKKVKKVVFDRGSKLYAGRMTALADAARKEGLEF